MGNKPRVDWEVWYYKDTNIVILHRDDNGSHAMIPPFGAREAYMRDGWGPRSSVIWLNRHKDKWNEIKCSCGYIIPVPIIERFIQMVNLIGRE